jgi:hypothetical protein
LYLNAIQGVNDTSFEYIGKIPALTQLTVMNTPGITDASLIALRNLKSPDYISISNTSVTDAGILELREAFPDARTISVDGKSY